MSEKLLKNKNVRTTAFRLAVLEVFEKHNTAIDVAQIEQELGEHDRVTLYRTINTFIDAGIIHEIALSGHAKKLALCAHDCEVSQDVHSHEHIHFECTKCQQIYCLETPKFPQISIKGFQVDALEVSAKGTCDKCA